MFCYLFNYDIDLPAGATDVTLPGNERIRVMAMTVADNPNEDTAPAQPLFDRITAAYVKPHGGLYIDPVTVIRK